MNYQVEFDNCISTLLNFENLESINNKMDNPNLIYHIPENEITDTASLLDAIKKRIIEDEKSLDLGIFLRGPNKGICIELVHPDLDETKPEKTVTIHISFEGFLF